MLCVHRLWNQRDTEPVCFWRSQLNCLRCQRAQLTANKAHFPQYSCNMFPQRFHFQIFSFCSPSSARILFFFLFSMTPPCVRNLFTTARHATASPPEDLPSTLGPLNTLFERVDSATLTLACTCSSSMRLCEKQKLQICDKWRGSSEETRCWSHKDREKGGQTLKEVRPSSLELLPIARLALMQLLKDDHGGGGVEGFPVSGPLSNILKFFISRLLLFPVLWRRNWTGQWSRLVPVCV